MHAYLIYPNAFLKFRNSVLPKVSSIIANNTESFTAYFLQNGLLYKCDFQLHLFIYYKPRYLDLRVEYLKLIINK